MFHEVSISEVGQLPTTNCGKIYRQKKMESDWKIWTAASNKHQRMHLHFFSHSECWILRVNGPIGFSSMAVVPRRAIFLLKRDLPLLICQHCSRSIIPQQPVLCDNRCRSLSCTSTLRDQSASHYAWWGMKYIVTPCDPTKPSFHTCPSQRLLLN